jgi:hypothetical protein
LILISVSTVFGQSNTKISEKKLATHFNGTYVGTKLFILPTSINKFLPNVFLGKRRNYLGFKVEQRKIVNLVENTKILRATEFTSPETRKKINGKTVIVGGVSDRGWFPSIEFNNKGYIFSENDNEANIEVFNLFLKDSKLSVQNTDEALELLKLYFYLAENYTDDGGKVILSTVESIPELFRRGKEIQINNIRDKITPPKVFFENGEYLLELFTWEFPLNNITQWRFKLNSNSIMLTNKKDIGKI